jgi:predicted acetyltransferase
MTDNQTDPPEEFQVVLASPEQKQVLANLLELYIHDFSELIEIRLGNDGRFGYEDLDLYWKGPGRYPFLVMVDGRPAGFALVRKGSEISDDSDAWDMAEFFIVRGLRRLGLGMKTAHAIWKEFPGKWAVRVMDRNSLAVSFWARAIDQFVGEPVEAISLTRGEVTWQVFTFESATNEE